MPTLQLGGAHAAGRPGRARRSLRRPARPRRAHTARTARRRRTEAAARSGSRCTTRCGLGATARWRRARSDHTRGSGHAPSRGGNTIVLHTEHLLPMRWGSSASVVNQPSTAGLASRFLTRRQTTPFEEDFAVVDDTTATRSAVHLANDLRTGVLSSRELLELYLDRVERLNPAINAVVTLDAERARSAADAADAAPARWRRARPAPRLAGHHQGRDRDRGDPFHGRRHRARPITSPRRTRPPSPG